MTEKKWISVDPIHCHQRLPKNTLVDKLRILSDDKSECELLLKIKPKELDFFFDHEIDHIPGMVEVNALRQSALALAHLVYDVPMNYVAVIDWLDVQLYSFGELNIETIANIRLAEKKQAVNRMEFVLDGLLLQGSNLLMRMKGKLIAFSPEFAKKIRYKKATVNDVAKATRQPELKQAEQSVVEIHIIIKPQEFEQACEAIDRTLRNKAINKYGLVPLYYTFDEEDNEARICLLFIDPKLLGDFVVEKIRRIKGVEGTQVRLTLDGKVYPKGVIALTEAKEELVASHIFLKVDPVLDDSVWHSLSLLPSTSEVFPTWCMRDFYDYDRDISLRVMGESKNAIGKYITNHIKTIKGISVIRIKFMKKLIKIQSDQYLLDIAKKWIRE